MYSIFFFLFPYLRSCAGTELPKQSVSNIAKCIAGICAKAEVNERVDIVKVCLLSVCVCVCVCVLIDFLIFMFVFGYKLHFIKKWDG